MVSVRILLTNNVLWLLVWMFTISALLFQTQRARELQARIDAGWFPPAQVEAYNEGKQYKHVVVPLEGHVYKGCTFDNVIVLYNGHGPVLMKDNHLTGSISLHSDNSSVILQALEPYMVDFTDESAPQDAPQATPEATPSGPDGVYSSSWVR